MNLIRGASTWRGLRASTRSRRAVGGTHSCTSPNEWPPFISQAGKFKYVAGFEAVARNGRPPVRRGRLFR